MKKLVFTLFLLVFVGCESNSTKFDNTNEGSDDSDNVAVCTEEKTKCIDDAVFKCEEGEWAEWEDCAAQGLVCAVKAGVRQIERHRQR
ncbi:MAG: hypothetical protein ACOX2F_04065 [bacterium]